ncbi:archease [Chloroflexota bacterium]
MRRFRLIEHTADTGLVAYGKNLTEAFANTAYGLFLLIVEPNNIIEKESRKVTVQAQDTEGLLFNWINELIYIFEMEHLLLKSFIITEFTGQSLEATCRGEKYDPSHHQLKTGVKSATYHMLKVDREKNRVQIIFDV